MDIVINIFMLFILTVGTIMDLYCKKIWVPFFVANYIVLIVLEWFADDNVYEKSIVSVVIMLFFIMLSYITKKQIGVGDGIILGITAMGVGAVNAIFLIYLSLVLAFVVSAYLLLIKKKGKKYTIPFIPFVLVSYVVCLGGGSI